MQGLRKGVNPGVGQMCFFVLDQSLNFHGRQNLKELADLGDLSV